MNAQQRETFIKAQNTFRHNYKSVTLMNIKTVDEEFELDQDECKKIGLNCKGCKKRRMTIRKIMHTWKSTNGEKTIWDIEKGIENRFYIVAFTSNCDGVRREAHNLLKLLKGREDFEDITGNWRAMVEGGDLIPQTNEYKSILESTAIRIDEENDEKRGEKKDNDLPRQVKAAKVQSQLTKNAWNKEFQVKEIIAKNNEDGPSTVTTENESLVTLKYKDNNGDSKSLQMTKRDMLVYNVIMQGIEGKLKDHEETAKVQQRQNQEAIETITNNVKRSTEELKEKQSENEKQVESLQNEVKNQQKQIEKMNKNQEQKIEECQVTVQNDIAELKELMMGLASMSSQKSPKRQRDKPAGTPTVIKESPKKRRHTGEQKTENKNNKMDLDDTKSLKIKQEIMNEVQNPYSKAKLPETIVIDENEEKAQSYKEKVNVKVKPAEKSTVVLTSLGRTAKALGIGKVMQLTSPQRKLRQRTDKPKSQEKGNPPQNRKATGKSPRRRDQSQGS